MGACLLLAYKFNEPNIGIAKPEAENVSTLNAVPTKLNKKSDVVFSLLLEFLAHEWSLGPKELFSAEWGVFVALEFNLHASPSQVAFHFKRLMKNLERRPLTYLGPVMFEQWCDCLDADARRKEKKEKKKERMREKKNQKLIELELMHAIDEEEREEESRRAREEENGISTHDELTQDEKDDNRYQSSEREKSVDFTSGTEGKKAAGGLWDRILKKGMSNLSLAADESSRGGNSDSSRSPGRRGNTDGEEDGGLAGEHIAIEIGDYSLDESSCSKGEEAKSEVESAEAEDAQDSVV
jgi:hypothetical protein